jgi:hypothetical protein
LRFLATDMTVKKCIKYCVLTIIFTLFFYKKIKRGGDKKNQKLKVTIYENIKKNNYSSNIFNIFKAISNFCFDNLSNLVFITILSEALYILHIFICLT